MIPVFVTFVGMPFGRAAEHTGVVTHYDPMTRSADLIVFPNGTWPQMGNDVLIFDSGDEARAYVSGAPAGERTAAFVDTARLAQAVVSVIDDRLADALATIDKLAGRVDERLASVEKLEKRIDAALPVANSAAIDAPLSAAP